MDYRKIAYGSIIDIKGRKWDIDLLRKTDSPLAARQLTFDADSAAVVEWDEFDLESPIQGSSLTLRIISQADREWIGLYTVNDADIVAEVSLEGELWWRGALDAETYEEPYEKADNYTVELRFSDFGPLKRMEYVPSTDIRLQRLGDALGRNLLKAGTVRAIDADGLPANADKLFPHESYDYKYLDTAAPPTAFMTDPSNPVDGYIKAWDALAALLMAANLRMVQRAGRIVLFNLKALREDADTSECVWSGEAQTLSADRISSKVTVSHDGEPESSLVRKLEFKKGAATINRAFKCQDSVGSTGTSFTLRQATQATWEYPTLLNAKYGFFRLDAGLDAAPDVTGWPLKCSALDVPSPAFENLNATLSFMKLQTARMATPEVYIPLGTNRDTGLFHIHVLQRMMFSAKENPFGSDKDPYEKEQDKLKNVHVVYVLAQLVLRGESGKTYYCSNRDYTVRESFYYRPTFSAYWKTSEDFMWLQYRRKDKYEKNNGVVCGEFMANQALIPIYPAKENFDGYPFDRTTQKLPDGEFVSLPPEAGWLSLRIYPVVACYGKDFKTDDLGKLRWILAEGAEIGITDHYETPEEASTEIKVICNNGAEDEVEITPLLGTSGGYCGSHTSILAPGYTTTDFIVSDGEPELATATEIASQLCMRRTRLAGEAYLDTAGGMAFTERLQGSKRFLLVSERMDLRLGFGDRVITELVRTDIDGLEVRRNDIVIRNADADRGGRDGKDAVVYSIVPTVGSVSAIPALIAVEEESPDGNIVVP